MNANNSSIRFLYGTAPGRLVLKLLLKGHLDKPAVSFLRSGLSRPMIKNFARKNDISLTPDELRSFHTYRDFFLRDRDGITLDMEPSHLISPCDSWLSAFKIREDSSFTIKGSRYRLQDFIRCDDPEELIRRYEGGDCLVFRLCASDYHHYCYIDDCYVHSGHYIPGELHSVQPLCCETYPVYTLNRRNWCLMETTNFGPVIQTEVGAFIVGGIVNHHSDCKVTRGTEKGHFDLAGSTIVLLFEKGRIKLRSEITDALKSSPEVRVELGMHIGYSCHCK